MHHGGISDCDGQTFPARLGLSNRHEEVDNMMVWRVLLFPTRIARSIAPDRLRTARHAQASCARIARYSPKSDMVTVYRGAASVIQTRWPAVSEQTS
jgi:hypothetical protein